MYEASYLEPNPVFESLDQLLGDLHKRSVLIDEQLAARDSAKILAALPKAAAAYKRQIEKGLEADRREANKAGAILRDLLGPIQMCPGEDGSLWAEFDARPADLLKKAVGTSVESGGSGGAICTYRVRIE